ncbi:MAG: hypothetical protein FJY29_03305 [Betaproteobacteria bacterium]|nr:hypothetical protein [Betaproteobacteria bacterium]
MNRHSSHCRILPVSLLVAVSTCLSGCQLFSKSKTNTFVQKDKLGNIEALLLPYNDTIADAAPATTPTPATSSADSTSPASADSDTSADTADTSDAVTTAFKKMGQCWYLVRATDVRKKKIDLANINLSLPADQADAVEGAELITKNYVPTPALIGAMKRDPSLKNMRAQYDNTKQRLTEASQRNFSNLTSNPVYVATIGGTIASQAFLNDRLGNMSAEQLLAGKEKAVQFWQRVAENSAMSKFRNAAVVTKLAGPRNLIANSAYSVFDKAHEFCFRNPKTARVMGLACVTALVTTLTAAIQGSVNMWTEGTEKPPPLFKADKQFLDEFAAAISDIEKEAVVTADELSSLVRVGDQKNPEGILRKLGKRPGAACPNASQAARNMRVASGLEQ